MARIDQILLAHLQITDHELVRRKELLNFTADDDLLLRNCKQYIEEEIDNIIAQYCQTQTRFDEMAQLLSDAEVARKLHAAQRRYVLGLFGGCTGLKYVANRFRIGLIHRRLGVAPQIYLTALKTLKDTVANALERRIPDSDRFARTSQALDKLLYFDIILVFDTFYRSLASEVEAAKTSAEEYAARLELQVAEHTQQLEEKVVQLERALTTVKRLEGVIPICGVCKKIRNDKESWQQLEQFISEHSQALFSHGLCPECYEKQMRAISELQEEKEGETQQ